MTLATIEPEFSRVPLSLIDEPENPSRSTMDDDKLDELVHSMRAQGFTSTVVLARVGERFEVIAGHRRLMAARRALIVAVPALIYPSKTVSLEAIKFGENKLREELTPDQEAVYFNRLLESECGGDTDKLAALLGEKRGYVEGRLALLFGHEDVFNALKAGEINLGIAQQLNRCPDVKHVRYLLVQAISCGATVAIVQQWIHEFQTLHSHVQALDGAGGPVGTTGPPVADDYFTCRVCNLKENPQEMRPLQIHTYCQSAVLWPALDFFQRRRDFVEWPRTDREAIALIQQLTERFPSLAEESAVIK